MQLRGSVFRSGLYIFYLHLLITIIYLVEAGWVTASMVYMGLGQSELHRETLS